MAGLVRQYLGNYRLKCLLGDGGFAEVYLGEHIYLKTEAAIKVLRMQLVNEAQASFLHEARTIARLEHPNIVRVLEFGVDRYTPYLVMSYASNGTLRQRYPQGTILPATAILPFVKQIAAALQYAHDKKLIHRDIKPENMLVGGNDQVLLSDFGLAIIFPDTPGADHAHLQDRAGTMAYMAPEQMQGKACPASDQYALGIAVYEWLCGSWPFKGHDLEIALQHAQLPPPSLHERVSTISPAIERVVMKALAKRPSERFPGVQEFATAFEQACVLEPRTQSISTPVRPALPDIVGPEHFNTPNTPIFTPRPHRVYRSIPIFTPQSVSTSIPFSPDPSITTNPTLFDHESAAIAEPVASLPAPTHLLPDRTPLYSVEPVLVSSLPSSISAVPARSFPQSIPQTPDTDKPTVLAERRFTRRSVLAGLAGAAAVGILGGSISMLVSSSKPQTAATASGRKVSRSATSTNTSAATQPQVSANHRSSVNSTASHGSSSAPSPGSGNTTTAGTQPSPMQRQPLTVQFTNPPSQVQNNSLVNVNVKTNEPGVMVTLHVTYNAPSPKDVILQRTTSSSGDATFPWQVRVSNAQGDATHATLTVSAVDQSGQKAEASSLIVPVTR